MQRAKSKEQRACRWMLCTLRHALSFFLFSIFFWVDKLLELFAADDDRFKFTDCFFSFKPVNSFELVEGFNFGGDF